MKHTSIVSSLAIFAGVFPVRALAQGNDNCATAQTITGTGAFAFDNSTATTDGLPDGLCNFVGTSQIEEDVWWSWTAPTSDSYSISTCTQTSIDSRIAVYDGSCAGVVLACNDDACSLQSTVIFSATAGHVYIIRLGDYPGTSLPGSGFMTIGVYSVIEGTAVNPTNGHTYHQLIPMSWTAAEAMAVSMGGHLATLRNQAEHDWIVQNFHIYQGNAIDLWIGFNDAAVEGTFAWSSGEAVTFTNWDLGEPNNANAGEDYTIVRKNNPNGLWNDLNDTGGSFHFAMHGIVELGSSYPGFCPGDGSIGACPCGNNGATGKGCNNSGGTGGAKLGAVGTTSPDTIVLTSTGEMPVAPGIFLQGNLALGSPVTFGDGLRCAGGVLKRLYVKPASAGVATAPAAGDPSISTQSANLGDPIAPGSTRWYQRYYRDPDPTFCPVPTGNTWNASSGIIIAW